MVKLQNSSISFPAESHAVRQCRLDITKENLYKFAIFHQLGIPAKIVGTQVVEEGVMAGVQVVDAYIEEVLVAF